MTPAEQFQAHKDIILSKVIEALNAKDHVAEMPAGGGFVYIDNQHASVWFDYDDRAGRKFTIDASGGMLPGREGKFAYKDLTTDVNYELIVQTLLKQVEARERQDDATAKRKAKRERVEQINAEFGCDTEEADIYLYVGTEGSVNVALPQLKDPELARKFLQALSAAGLLHATSKEHEAEVSVGDQA